MFDYTNNIKIQNNKVGIPIPNTKFIMKAEKQQYNIWNVYLCDPANCRKEEVITSVKNTAFRLFCAISLKAPIID